MLCAATEFSQLPVRHNEDKINASMAATARLPVDVRTADDPHTKTNLLLQVRGDRGKGRGKHFAARLPVYVHSTDDPHTKTNLLLPSPRLCTCLCPPPHLCGSPPQAHMSRERLPISDYITDTKSVLDNSLRVLQV